MMATGLGQEMAHEAVVLNFWKIQVFDVALANAAMPGLCSTPHSPKRR